MLVETIASGLRSASTFFHSARLISRFSVTASMIQSQSATFARSSSKLPGVISDAAESTKKPPGRCLAAFSTPLRGQFGRDIQQNRRNAGVGEVGGNTGAHGAGSEDGNALDGSHVQLEFINLTVFSAPGTLHAVFRRTGHRRLGGSNQTPPEQDAHRALHCAFGKTRRIRHGLMAQRGRFRSLAERLRPDVKINQKCRRRFVVAHQVPHQHVEHIRVERDFCHEGQYIARASIGMKVRTDCRRNL